MSASAQTNWVVWLSSSPTLLTTASSRELTKAAMQNKSRFTLKLQTSSISRLTGDRNIVVDLEQMIILDASAAVDSPFYDAASSPPLAPLKTRPCDAVENAIELTRHVVRPGADWARKVGGCTQFESSSTHSLKPPVSNA